MNSTDTDMELPVKKRQARALHTIEPVPQRVASLATMTAWLVLVVLSTYIAASTTGGEDLDLSRISAFAFGAAQDASWLLPALLAADLGLLAILITESLTSTGTRAVGAARGVLTASALFVGAAAGATVVLSVIGVLADPQRASKLFAIVILAAIVIGLSLWMSVLFFGDHAVQLAQIAELRRSAELALGRLRPRLRIPVATLYTVNILATTSVAFLTYAAMTVALGEPLPNPLGAALLLFSLNLFLSLVLLLVERAVVEWPSKFGRWAARLSTGIVFAGPVLYSAVELMSYGFVAAGCSVFASLLGIAVLTWMAFPSRSAGWTLRAVSDALARKRLSRKITELEGHAAELHDSQSVLIRV